ncbi:MAG: ATP-binding protein [Candidatus Omnitrophica bacterium]|nr:ATP-binding protein [Candidatus Omnitrophota bacterium]
MKRYILCMLLLYLFAIPSFSQTDNTEQFSLQDKIAVYREITKKETDPAILAEAHFKIAEILRQMGKDNEATAEYLKVVLNYPSQKDFAKVAEERLSELYNKFSESDIDKKDVKQSEDPAIFFTYIKTLYGTYSDSGEYDRALQLLQRLMKMDPENGQYYHDIGLLYINGYNDPDKALSYFKKLKQINKDYPSLDTDIGLAYEKKGDIDNAILFYSRAVDKFPFDSWSMYGLSRREALKLSKQGKFIKDWFFIGPFPNVNNTGMGVVFRPEIDIANMELEEEYVGKDNNRVKWQRPFSYKDSGYVDINNIFKDNDKSVFYAFTYVYSEKENIFQGRVGTEDPIKVWINNEVIFTKDKTVMPAKFDDDIFNMRLKKGWNTIFVKLAENYGSCGFYFRITDFSGNRPENVICDPLKDEKRVSDIFYSLKKAKIIKLIKGFGGGGSLVFLFVIAIYLVITNIYNKIKIRQLKEDFISSVSHELKTPLAAIKMFTETLSMGRIKDPEKVKDYYGTIIRETDRLTRFINKILDFQKIEKGQKVYSFDEVDIVEIARTASKIYFEQVHDPSLVMEQEYDENIPKLEIDEDAILQVILNLFLNAYKYSTQEKYTKIKVQNIEGNIKISIIDHGVGIPKDKLTKIFDRFYRVDVESTRTVKGSGIGLAFVKSVVDAHGGKIAVESNIGNGSTFYMLLPIHGRE